MSTPAIMVNDRKTFGSPAMSRAATGKGLSGVRTRSTLCARSMSAEPVLQDPLGGGTLWVRDSFFSRPAARIEALNARRPQREVPRPARLPSSDKGDTARSARLPSSLHSSLLVSHAAGDGCATSFELNYHDHLANVLDGPAGPPEVCADDRWLQGAPGAA